MFSHAHAPRISSAPVQQPSRRKRHRLARSSVALCRRGASRLLVTGIVVALGATSFIVANAVDSNDAQAAVDGLLGRIHPHRHEHPARHHPEGHNASAGARCRPCVSTARAPSGSAPTGCTCHTVCPSRSARRRRQRRRTPPRRRHNHRGATTTTTTTAHPPTSTDHHRHHHHDRRHPRPSRRPVAFLATFDTAADFYSRFDTYTGNYCTNGTNCRPEDIGDTVKQFRGSHDMACAAPPSTAERRRSPATTTSSGGARQVGHRRAT